MSSENTRAWKVGDRMIDGSREYIVTSVEPPMPFAPCKASGTVSGRIITDKDVDAIIEHLETEQCILDAYARYDSDPRVSGPDDYEAFKDAVIPLVETKDMLSENH